MINQRQGGRRRGRGQRGQNLGGQPGNRQDNRQRGNAAQLLEKYKNMARDAQLAGDRVQTEYYLQYADHYFRVLSENRARFEDQRRQRGDDLDEDEGEDGVAETADPEAGEERDVSYHGFGISPWKSYKVREYFSKLAFSYRGQVCWQTQGNNVPGFIQLKEGETIEQVLRRSERPSYAFYQHVELPKMLLKPSGQGGLGSSEVTVAGVQ